MWNYNDHVLKPTLTQLAKFMRQEEQHSSGEGDLNALCAEDNDDDNGIEEENGDQDDTLPISRVEELRSYRSTCVLDTDQVVLEWWRGHKSDFPLVAELARIVLAV